MEMRVDGWLGVGRWVNIDSGKGGERVLVVVGEMMVKW